MGHRLRAGRWRAVFRRDKQTKTVVILTVDDRKAASR